MRDSGRRLALQGRRGQDCRASRDVAASGFVRAPVQPFSPADRSFALSDHTMPASVLAQGIVSRALRKRPARYYTAGGKSWLFWVFERIPRIVVWTLLGRILGTDKVGRKRR